MKFILNKKIFDESDVLLWRDKLNKLLVDAGFDSRDLDKFPEDIINLNFSNEIKYKTYGYLNEDEIIKNTIDKLNLSEKCREPLQNIIKHRDLEEGLLSKIADNEDVEYEDLKEYFDDQLDFLCIKTKSLGEYNEKLKTITLFIKAINEYASENSIRPEIICETVFIHEYFHALHYMFGEDELLFRGDYTSDVVKESLAVFVEMKYCAKYKLPYVDDFNGASVITFPYAGAKYVFDFKKFKTIFDVSLADLDKALRILLPKISFYKIKNLIEIVNESSFMPNLKGSFKVKGVTAYCYPEDEAEFFNSYIKKGVYSIEVFYKDGTIESHIANSKSIKDYNALINNIKTCDIIKKNSNISKALFILVKTK